MFHQHHLKNKNLNAYFYVFSNFNLLLFAVFLVDLLLDEPHISVEVQVVWFFLLLDLLFFVFRELVNFVSYFLIDLALLIDKYYL